MKKSQLVLLIVVVIGTIVALSVVGSMASQVQYSVLFSGMEEADAGNVYNVLTEMGVTAKAEGNGTILVPADQVDELRYQLNAQGYPQSGLNYDIYTSNASSFGMTDEDKKLYLKFQLEQNISQTINRMDKIKSSTVMITLADTSQFVLSDQKDENATASVVLELKDGQTLTENDAETIRAVVSKSVGSLPPENITIADSQMNIYNGASESGAGSVSDQIELQNQVAEQLRQQIVNLLTPVFGKEKLSASVNVILDFDKETTNSITLSPPTENDDNTGIIVSMKQMEERIANGATTTGEPGLDTNGGGTTTYQASASASASGDYYSVTKEINAEVNQINQQLEKAQGTIKDLSATLIIDGGDELTELLPDIKKQVATAIGVPEDKITVSNMAFEQNTQYDATMAQQKELMDKVEKNKMIQTIIIAGAILAAVLIVIGIIVSQMKKKKQSEAEIEAQMQQYTGRKAVDVMADEELSIEDLLAKEKNGTLEQLQGLVKKDSELIAQLLRNWLSDDYRR